MPARKSAEHAPTPRKNARFRRSALHLRYFVIFLAVALRLAWNTPAFAEELLLNNGQAVTPFTLPPGTKLPDGWLDGRWKRYDLPPDLEKWLTPPAEILHEALPVPVPPQDEHIERISVNAAALAAVPDNPAPRTPRPALMAAASWDDRARDVFDGGRLLVQDGGNLAVFASRTARLADTLCLAGKLREKGTALMRSEMADLTSPAPNGFPLQPPAVDIAYQWLREWHAFAYSIDLRGPSIVGRNEARAGLGGPLRPGLLVVGTQIYTTPADRPDTCAGSTNAFGAVCHAGFPLYHPDQWKDRPLDFTLRRFEVKSERRAWLLDAPLWLGALARYEGTGGEKHRLSVDRLKESKKAFDVDRTQLQDSLNALSHRLDENSSALNNWFKLKRENSAGIAASNEIIAIQKNLLTEIDLKVSDLDKTLSGIENKALDTDNEIWKITEDIVRMSASFDTACHGCQTNSASDNERTYKNIQSLIELKEKRSVAAKRRLELGAQRRAAWSKRAEAREQRLAVVGRLTEATVARAGLRQQAIAAVSAITTLQAEQRTMAAARQAVDRMAPEIERKATLVDGGIIYSNDPNGGDCLTSSEQ